MFYSNIEPEPFRVWQTSSSAFCVYSPDIYDKNNQNIYIFGVLVQTVKFLIEWHHFSSSVAVCNHLKTSFVCLLKRYTFSLMHSEPEYIHWLEDLFPVSHLMLWTALHYQLKQ